MFKLLKDKNFNSIVHFDDGEKIEVYANSIHNSHLDQWQGWHCHAGVDRIHIDADSNVYSGECENDFLGNINDNSFKILSKPTICKRERCTGCTDDLLVKKWK